MAATCARFWYISQKYTYWKLRKVFPSTATIQSPRACAHSAFDSRANTINLGGFERAEGSANLPRFARHLHVHAPYWKLALSCSRRLCMHLRARFFRPALIFPARVVLGTFARLVFFRYTSYVYRRLPSLCLWALFLRLVFPPLSPRSLIPLMAVFRDRRKNR